MNNSPITSVLNRVMGECCILLLEPLRHRHQTVLLIVVHHQMVPTLSIFLQCYMTWHRQTMRCLEQLLNFFLAQCLFVYGLLHLLFCRMGNQPFLLSQELTVFVVWWTFRSLRSKLTDRFVCLVFFLKDGTVAFICFFSNIQIAPTCLT